MADDDPAAIRSLAVSADDVANAFVYTRENPGTAVLRVTPPFHGRMRARLHVRHDPRSDAGTDAIHVDPATLLADDVVAAYPTLEDVEADLAARDGADGGSGDGEEPGDTDAGGGPPPARLGEAHADALEAWRERALESIVESAVLETSSGTTRVDVKRLE